jgi:hypothetical protein
VYRLIENQFNDLTGGETSIFAPGKMEPKYSLLLQNLYIGKDNKIRKMLGYKPIHENRIQTGVNSGIKYVYGSIQRTFVGGQGRIYERVPLLGGGYELSKVYESASASTSTAKIEFAQMGNKLVAVNGDDVTCTLVGDTWEEEDEWTLLQNTKPMKPFVYKNRMWYINAENKQEALHSALQDATTIEGYIDFSGVLPQADELIDIKGYLDFICFIFKNHVLVYSGNVPSGQDADFALYQVVPLSGILSSQTNLNVNNGLFLLTKTGIKTLAMVYPSTKIVVNDFSQINDPEIMRMIQEEYDGNYVSSGYWVKEDLYFWTFGRYGIVFSGKYKAFSRLVFPSEGAQWTGSFMDVDGHLNVLAGGYLHQYGNDYKYNGEDQLCIWKTGWLPLHPYGATCFPKYADVLVAAAKSGGQIEVNGQVFNGEFVSQDFALGLFDVEYDNPVIASRMDKERFYQWDEDFYMDGYTPTPMRVPLLNCGKFLCLTFAEKSAINGLEFNGIGVYSDRRRR